MHLITGGSGSGKSAYAEEQILAMQGDCRIYIATMDPYDEESRQRIARHRKMRAEKNFTTVECYRDLEKTEIPEHADVLLECMSNLTANEMYQEGGAKDRCVEEIMEGIRAVQEQCGHLVVVSNEIFSDGIRYDPETRRYQRYLGQINQKIAEKADLVVEVVYSIPVVHKGNLEKVKWTG